nr:hypothetical protein [Tanacetum cinerariifolium]
MQNHPHASAVVHPGHVHQPLEDEAEVDVDNDPGNEDPGSQFDRDATVRPRPRAEDHRLVTGGVAQVDAVKAQHREARGVGLRQTAVSAFKGLVQIAATLQAFVALQLPVVEVASDDHRGIVGQRVKQIAEQVQLQLPVALKQAQVDANGVHFSYRVAMVTVRVDRVTAVGEVRPHAVGKEFVVRRIRPVFVLGGVAVMTTEDFLEKHQGGEEENPVIAHAQCHRTHERAGDGQRQIKEHCVGAEACAATAVGHLFDGLDAERRVHQRQPEAGQACADQGKSCVGCQPQQHQADSLHGHAGDGRAKPAKAVDGIDEQQARHNEADTENADGGEGQAQAKRRHPAKHGEERQAFTAHHRDRRFFSDQQQGADCQQRQHHAQAGKAQRADHHHAQWSANGNGAIGRNAASDDQNGQADAGEAFQQHRGEGQHAAQGDAREPIDDGALGADGVADTACDRTAQEGRQVLRTNHQPGDHCAEPQLVMHVAGHHGDGQTDAQERDEGVDDDGDDLQCDRHRAGVTDRRIGRQGGRHEDSSLERQSRRASRLKPVPLLERHRGTGFSREAVSALIVIVVSAAEVGHAAWAQLDDARGQGRHELAVVADEDQRARVVLQRQVQRLDRLHVQVVGRLVHDQHVRLLQDQLAEQHAALLTTGDDLDRLEDLVVGEQHAAQGATDDLLTLR